MAPKNVTVMIGEVDEVNDSIYLHVGSFGYPVTLSRFRELIQGNLKHGMDIEHLIRNVAIRAALSNVDINDINSIKAAIEGVPFKV
ncbi:MAG: hypothetical protein AABY51_10060 [Deltaproteobacteria bacterium]